MALSTMPELVAHAARIVDATGADVICDIDTGFGGSNSVRRITRAFERAGIAAVQIENQAESPNSAHSLVGGRSGPAMLPSPGSARRFRRGGSGAAR